MIIPSRASRITIQARTPTLLSSVSASQVMTRTPTLSTNNARIGLTGFSRNYRRSRASGRRTSATPTKRPAHSARLPATGNLASSAPSSMSTTTKLRCEARSRPWPSTIQLTAMSASRRSISRRTHRATSESTLLSSSINKTSRSRTSHPIHTRGWT